MEAAATAYPTACSPNMRHWCRRLRKAHHPRRNNLERVHKHLIFPHSVSYLVSSSWRRRDMLFLPAQPPKENPHGTSHRNRRVFLKARDPKPRGWLASTSHPDRRLRRCHSLGPTNPRRYRQNRLDVSPETPNTSAPHPARHDQLRVDDSKLSSPSSAANVPIDPHQESAPTALRLDHGPEATRRTLATLVDTP